MKIETLSLIISSLALSFGCASAATSINFEFGSLKDSMGVKVPDGTKYVLIANSDNIAGLPGGLTTNLTSSGLNPTLAQIHFANKSLTVGSTINDDKIIHVGTVNGAAGYGPTYAGIAYDSNIPISYTEGVAVGQSFGIYWFPGLIGNDVGSGGFEIGGFFNAAVNLGDIGMTLQADGAYNIVIQRDTDAAALDGFTSSISPSAFTAIIAIPEPTPLIVSFSALSFAALLRRRRN